MTSPKILIPDEATSSSSSIQHQSNEDGSWEIRIKVDEQTHYDVIMLFKLSLARGAPAAAAMELARRFFNSGDEQIRFVIEELVGFYPKDSSPTRILEAALRKEALAVNVAEEPFVFPVSDPDGTLCKAEAQTMYLNEVLAQGVCLPRGMNVCTPKGCPKAHECRKQIEDGTAKSS